MVITEMTVITTMADFTGIKTTDTMPTADITTMEGFTEKEDYHPDKRRKFTAVKAPSIMRPVR